MQKWEYLVIDAWDLFFIKDNEFLYYKLDNPYSKEKTNIDKENKLKQFLPSFQTPILVNFVNSLRSYFEFRVRIFNALGQEGWELIETRNVYGAWGVFHFKRLIEK